MNTFRDLIVWQKSKELVLQTYKILRTFPKEEVFGLSSQMKRAAISVSSNIAEGNQRRSIKERNRFFNIAQGSLIELDCQLEISLELDFISKMEYKNTLELINKTGFLLTRLIKSEIHKTCPPTNPTKPTKPTNRNQPNYD